MAETMPQRSTGLRKTWRIVLFALACAVALSFAHNLPGAPANLLFHLHVGRSGETARIGLAIKQYNKASAGIYATGGLLDELNVIPAAPLLKRALFQDINILRDNGHLMVFDLDSQKVERVDFINRGFALAVTKEVWGVTVQDFYTRKWITTIKGSEVRARYQLRKEKGQWIVHQLEVFPAKWEVPAPNVKPLL